MISKVFVDRPRLAAVVSIVLVVAGLMAIEAIPVSQYPPITPPVVQVEATYPGADAQTIADTVGGPIEEQVNGVKDIVHRGDRHHPRHHRSDRAAGGWVLGQHDQPVRGGAGDRAGRRRRHRGRRERPAHHAR